MIQVLEARIFYRTLEAPNPGMPTDEWVARDIFGWTRARTPENPFYDPWVDLWRPRPTGNPATPGWSRNPGHALEVIHAMRGKGFEVAITSHKDGYCATFVSGFYHGSATGDFPQAICLAALRTVGVL